MKMIQKELTIRNKLNKTIQNQGSNFLEKTEGIEWMTNYILNQAKNISSNQEYFPIDKFIEEAKNELNEYNKDKKASNKRYFDKSRLIRSLDNLVKLNIIRLGIELNCPICGLKNCYDVDDVKQVSKCVGCQNEIHIRSEVKWYYKLNSLVSSGISQHGLVTLVLVLGQLSDEARNSFIFSPNLDLFKGKFKKHITDIDLICIKDGLLVLCEVKNSVKLYADTDFYKASELVNLIKPDIFIFSSLVDNKPNRLVRRNIHQLNEKYFESGTEVKWYELNSNIYRPTPYYLV